MAMFRRRQPDDTLTGYDFEDDTPTDVRILPPDDMAWRTRHQMQQVLNAMDFLTASVKFDLYGSTKDVVSRAVVMLRAGPDADERERLQGYASRARHRTPARRRQHAQVIP